MDLKLHHKERPDLENKHAAVYLTHQTAAEIANMLYLMHDLCDMEESMLNKTAESAELGHLLNRFTTIVRVRKDSHQNVYNSMVNLMLTLETKDA